MWTRLYHVSIPLNAKKSKRATTEDLLSFTRIEEDENARKKREEKEKKPKSFNMALEFSGKADPIGPQPVGAEKWTNFAFYILLPIFIGGVVIYFIHDYIVESAFGGDDTEIFEYMIGECFELAVANDQVMQKLGGQMSTDDTRVQFIPKDQGMRNIAVLPLYGTPGKVARCEVDLRTLHSGEIGVYSARVIFPGGEVIRLEAPPKRYSGRYWQDNIARDQEERAELERKQQQQQMQQARMQGGLR
jgi:hypothetical protein